MAKVKDPKRVAIGAKSRRKGSRFERKVANDFEKWLGIQCRRTPMSGAYGEEWNLGGDLMFDRPIPWYVELKRREGWRLETFFAPTGPGKMAYQWATKAEGEALKAGKVPMVIFSKNYTVPFIMIPERHIVGDLGIGVSWFTKYMLINGWLITTFSEFKRVVSPESVVDMDSTVLVGDQS
jgi:hypothetical protein|tara:strand:+ start:405 stop:944 length:540 start_codon:yes stop_codon:yes gene_type:complete